MEFSSHLSQLMETNNTSISTLARYVGVSRQSVMRWLDGSKPSYDKVSKIAEFFDVPITSFTEVPEKQLINDIYNATVIKSVLQNRIPIVGSIQAGYPVQSFDVNQGYVTTDLQSDNLYALKVIGDSMMPIVMEGDIIICDKMHSNPNGKICVVTVDGESTLKKVKKDSTGITLVPTNPMYRELHFSPKQCEEKDLRIDGVLVEMIRKF